MSLQQEMSDDSQQRATEEERSRQEETERKEAEDKKLREEFFSAGGKPEDVNTVAWWLFMQIKALERTLDSQAAAARWMIGTLWVVVACLSIALLCAAKNSDKQSAALYDGQPLEHWLKELEHGHVDKATAALKKTIHDPRFRDVVDAHLTILLRDNGERRVPSEQIAQSLRSFGPEMRTLAQKDRTLVPRLMLLLDSKDYYSYSSAVYILGDLGPHAWEAVPDLIDKLAHFDDRIRRASAESLGKVGRRAVRPLIQTIATQKNRDALCGACDALSYIGEDARAASPTLVHLLEQDGDDQVRSHAGYALTTIRGINVRETLVPALIRLLDAPADIRARIRSVQALGNLGVEAEPAIPALKKILRQPREQQQEKTDLAEHYAKAGFPLPPPRLFGWHPGAERTQDMIREQGRRWQAKLGHEVREAIQKINKAK